MNALTAGFTGFLFGLGLAISNMLSPARVIGFLDLFGTWDPTLALVMGGAILVTIPGFAWAKSRKDKPWFAGEFSWPSQSEIDIPLILGAALFGVGWAIGGLCPGPAIAAMASGSLEVIAFVAVMIASWWATDRVIAART